MGRSVGAQWHQPYNVGATSTCSLVAYPPCVRLGFGCEKSRRLPLWVRPGFSLQVMAVAHRLCGMELGLRHRRSFACLTGFKGAQRPRTKDFGRLSKSTHLKCTISSPTVAGLHPFVTEQEVLRSSNGGCSNGSGSSRSSSNKVPLAIGRHAATAADVSRHCG